MRVAETSIISLAVCNWILKVFYNHLSARSRWRAPALTENAGYVRFATGRPLRSVYSGDENSPAGIPDILLIPVLTEAGCAGKNVLAQEGKGSEHWGEPSFLWGMRSLRLCTDAVFIMAEAGKRFSSFIFFGSDVEESQETVQFE